MFNPKESGFTLMELMIALSILSILTLISVPLYTHHRVVCHRQQAELALLQAANRMEGYYQRHGSYRDAEQSLHFDDLLTHDSYRLQLQNLTDENFEIIALAQGSQKKDDNGCGNLIVNEQDQHKITGNKSVTECWGHG